MSCGILNGLISTCEDLRRSGGVNKRVYVFNIDDLIDNTPYTFDTDGCISAINFDSYGGMYEFQSTKNAHTAGYTVVNSGDGGNKFFQHDAVLKLFSNDCLDDQVIQDLIVSDVGIIAETNNQEFKLYGGFNGMNVTDGTQNSGQVAASDITDTITFVGEERDMPKRVVSGDYATTKAYLASLVI